MLIDKFEEKMLAESLGGTMGMVKPLELTPKLMEITPKAMDLTPQAWEIEIIRSKRLSHKDVRA